MKSIFKPIWWSLRHTKSYGRYLFFKITLPSYFKNIGKRSKFFGRVRFGTVEGNITLGNDCMIGHDIFLSAAKTSHIKVGARCSLNTACHIVAVRGISIGEGTRVGEFCSIRDQNHQFENPEIAIVDQGFSGEPIKIGEDCWIGRGVIITAGVTLGKGCVVGANSVVTKSFEPFLIIAGSPAKMIRRRGDRLTKQMKLS